MPPYQVRGRLIESGMTVRVVIPANPGSGVQGEKAVMSYQFSVCLSHSTNQPFNSPFLGSRPCFQLNEPLPREVILAVILLRGNELNELNGLIIHYASLFTVFQLNEPNELNKPNELYRLSSSMYIHG